MSIEFRDYQQEDINFIYERRRVLLANDMGLGKTLTTLEAERRRKVEQGLILATKVAMGTWEYQQHLWYNEDSILYGGTPVQRKKQLQEYQKGNCRYLITNYKLAKELEHLHWQGLICDEIHTDHVGLLSPKSATFKQVNKMAQKIPNLVLVTGSPIRKHLGNLWTSLHMINEQRFPSYWSFINRYCHVLNNGFGMSIEKRPKDPLAFKELLKHYMIRRKLKLREKLRIPVLIEMSKAQTKLYEDLLRDAYLEVGDRIILTPNQMTMVLRLRQLLVTPQILGFDVLGGALESLPELLENEFATGYPAVVFTPFKQAVPYIEAQIRATTGATIYKIHGDQPDGTATQQSQAFQKQLDPRRVLICTIKSGASFDAFAACACFFVGYEWSSINNEQSEKRLDRIGQLNNVRCYYFVHKGTVETELLLPVLDERKGASDWILEPEAVLTLLKKLKSST